MNISGGKYNGKKIFAPDETIARPTLSKVRMGVFNTLYSLLGTFENKSFLDMYGGSGIMGLEAFSRGFSEVTVFEKNRTATKIIERNYNLFNLNPHLKIGDACKLLKNTNQIFDVIYIDPPYQSNLYEQSFSILIGHIKSNSIIIAEHLSELNVEGYELIKSKKYSDKIISYYKTSQFH